MGPDLETLNVETIWRPHPGPQMLVDSVIHHLGWATWFNHDAASCWMSFASYHDAAGAQHDPGNLIVAGVIASEDQWKKFEGNWKAALDREHIAEFHFTDFKASQGDFKGWKNDEPRRRTFVADLLHVIQNHIEGWSVVGIRPSTFHEVNRQYNLSVVGGPFLLCACGTREYARQWMDERHPGQSMAHFIEKGDAGQLPWAQLVDLDFRPQPKKDEFGRYTYPFQAADFIAGEFRTAFEDIQDPDRHIRVRYPFRTFFDKQKIVGKYLRADALLAICASRPDLFPPRV